MKRIVLICCCLLILVLQACEEKSKNPLIGHWESEKDIISYINKNHKTVKLKFEPSIMSINGKEISVIYKVNKNDVVIFYRGESLISFIKSEEKMILFIPGKGKRIYIKK